MFEQVESGVLQDMFTSIIEDADANILLVNDDFEVVSLNPGFYWIFLENYSIDLKPGNSIIEQMELNNPKLAQIWRERCLMALSGNPFRVEESFELDGRTFHWEIYYKGIQQNGNRFISVFSRDITIRKAYQKRILENEANLRSILNTIEDSVWLVNTRYELIDFNKEFFKRYRQAYGVRLAKGKNIIELLPENLPRLRELWRDRYASGLRGRPGKYYDTYPIDGQFYTYEIKTYPIVEDGKVTGLTIYSRDISQQKKTEDILKEQNEELTKINSELDRFVYSASHDLRAPLMSIKGLLNMIRLDDDADNVKRYHELIGKSIDKLDSFISDIINYSRNARMDLIAESIDFTTMLQESIQSLRFMDGADRVHSIKHIHAPTPFYSDPGRIQMIFNNIISNAVRYRDSTKPDCYLKISIDVNIERAVLVFEDNGVGIAEEYRDKIFKMFFRASSESKGSGLGLYIVKGAVEKLKGTVQVESNVGIGTTFKIELPNLAEVSD